MTKKSIFTRFAAILIAAIFIGCTNDDNPSTQPLAEQIIGKWVTVEYVDMPALTDEKVVLNFESSTTCFITMLLADDEEKGGWADNVKYDVTIADNVVTVSGEINERISSVYEFHVKSISANEWSALLKITDIIDGQKRTIEYPVRFVRVGTDHSEDILGLWEGIYWEDGVTRFRMEYLADGTYNFYFFNIGSEEWKKSHDDYSYYDCEGNLLYMRWKNIAQDPVCQAWDITSISNDAMTWRALRLDEDDNPQETIVELTRVPLNN